MNTNSKLMNTWSALLIKSWWSTITKTLSPPSMVLLLILVLIHSLEGSPVSSNIRLRRTTPNPSFFPAIGTYNSSHDDVLAELRHCSSKSSRDVNNCHKTYESDINQFGRRGEPCCGYVKFVRCLENSLILPCNKYVDRLVKLYIKEKPKHCEDVVYPSMSCLVIVNTNVIITVSVVILAVTVLCGLIHVCRCLCRCFKTCCGKFRETGS